MRVDILRITIERAILVNNNNIQITFFFHLQQPFPSRPVVGKLSLVEKLHSRFLRNKLLRVQYINCSTVLMQSCSQFLQKKIIKIIEDITGTPRVADRYDKDWLTIGRKYRHEYEQWQYFPYIIGNQTKPTWTFLLKKRI